MACERACLEQREPSVESGIKVCVFRHTYWLGHAHFGITGRTAASGQQERSESSRREPTRVEVDHRVWGGRDRIQAVLHIRPHHAVRRVVLLRHEDLDLHGHQAGALSELRHARNAGAPPAPAAGLWPSPQWQRSARRPGDLGEFPLPAAAAPPAAHALLGSTLLGSTWLGPKPDVPVELASVLRCENRYPRPSPLMLPGLTQRLTEKDPLAA